MFMAPPAMFSTTTAFAHLWLNWSAVSRASVSVVEPAAAGTTIFTVLDGNASCAWRRSATVLPAMITSARMLHVRITNSPGRLARDAFFQWPSLARAVLPRPLGRIGRLDAARLLDQFLYGAGNGQCQPGLIRHPGHDLHVLECPGEGNLVPVLQRLRLARAYLQRIAQRGKINASGLGDA